MAHMVETMAYANEVPWHGLGANVDQNSSVEEMVIAAGLNWRLERKKLFANMDGEMIDIKGRVAWIRNTDRKVMAVSGTSWRPLQPEETLGFMRDYVRAGAATLETAGSLRGGKVVWCLARLNHDFEVGRGDKVNGYLLITSPNAVGQAITIRTTTVRVVCANTMAMAERGSNAQYKQNHMSEFDVAAAKEAVGESHEQLAQAERNAKTLLKMKLSIDDAIKQVIAPVMFEEASADIASGKIAEDQYPKPLREILESLTSSPGIREIRGTGWGALNGVTHWADHVAGRNNGSRMHRAWVGDLARRKLEVERKLLEMAA